MKRADPEHHAQAAVFSWAKMMEAREPRLWLLHAIPNGGDRDVRVGAKMKREGVKRGVPDIHLPVRSGRHIGLYIEMKAKGRKTTDDQKEWLAALRNEGHLTRVCFTSHEAIETLSQYLNLS